MCGGNDLTDEPELVALPSGSVLVNELEGEPDLLDICHQDQGKVVVTLHDEGLGMLGLPSILGRGGGLDSWGRGGSWCQCQGRLPCLLGLGLCKGQGKLVSSQDELQVDPVEMDDGGISCCKSGCGVSGVVEEGLGEGWV